MLRSPPGKLGCSAPSPDQDGHHHHPDDHHGDFDDDIISIKSCQAQCSCSESSSNLISCTCFFPVLVSVFCLFFCLFFSSIYLQVDFDANIICFCLFSSVYLQVDRPCVVAVGICRRATVVANVLGVQEGQSQPTLLYITWSPSPSSM